VGDKRAPVPGSIEKILRDAGVQFKARSVSLVLDCPKCSKRSKLYIRRSDGRFVCWYCDANGGFSGKPEYALTELTGRPLSELRAELYGEDLPKNQKYLDVELGRKTVAEIEGPVPDIRLPANFHFTHEPQAAEGLAYLVSRGVSPEVAEEYLLMYCPTMRRVVFPVFSEDQRLVGYQARTIDPGVEPKILTSTPFPRNRTLMFLNRLRNSEHAVLFEGPFDAVKGHLCGGNVAAMGKKVGDGQIELIKSFGIKRLYLFLDTDALNDVSGVIDRAGEMECWVCRVPEGKKDAGECTPEEVLAQFRLATRATRRNLFIYLKR